MAGSMSALSRQIAAAVRENAAGAKEITRAAEKMNQLTHQMSEAVTEPVDVAGRLDGLGGPWPDPATALQAARHPEGRLWGRRLH